MPHRATYIGTASSLELALELVPALVPLTTIPQGLTLGTGLAPSLLLLLLIVLPQFIIPLLETPRETRDIPKSLRSALLLRITAGLQAYNRGSRDLLFSF